jgi:hypothetical protein
LRLLDRRVASLLAMTIPSEHSTLAIGRRRHFVMPAKAGIPGKLHETLDSRFRGNKKTRSIRERISGNACNGGYSAAVLFKRAVRLSAQRRPGSPPQSSQAI